MNRALIGIILTLFALTARASEPALQIDGCDEFSFSQAQAAYLLEPWEEHSRTFDDGKLRVSVLGAGLQAEPGYYLLILGRAPVSQYDPGPRQCRIVTFDKTRGFAWITTKQLSAKPGNTRRASLHFTLPVGIFLPDGSTEARSLFVGFDLENGGMTAKFEDE